MIITVIILLILAGTAISISINGGDLFGKSQNAVAQYNSRVAEENTALSELWGILDSMEGGVKQVNDANPGVLEGNGTASDPYTINSIEDLVAFAYNVNSYDPNNNTGTLYEGKTVALALDLDFQSDKSYANPETKYILDDNGYTPNPSGTAIKTLLTDTNGIGFMPVGNKSHDSGDFGFAGTFDGQNHALINLYENLTNIYGGLFGTTNKEITIHNLGIKSGNITSNYPIGILGWANSVVTITNCYNTGDVTGNGSAPSGGILGWANCWANSTATITNCYNTGDVTSASSNAGGILGGTDTRTTTIIITNCYNTGDVTSASYAGGILGYANSVVTIANCYNKGDVTSASSSVGGILGNANSTATITNCYNTGDVTCNGSAPAGGILGVASLSTTITNCYNTGDVTSINAPAGGILGYANSTATITNCYNTGDVTCGGNAPAGGILGWGISTPTITNCYNTGDVASTSNIAGGILGGVDSTAIITNCYNTGDVTSGGNTSAGGILGNTNSTATITNCYNTGDVTGNDFAGGILGHTNSTPTITNCHNTGNVIGTNTGEIIGSGGTAGTGCTYLTKVTNANANGATGVADMTETMSMANFVARMNQYVATNNADNTKPQLKTWTLSNGYPVFSN